MPNITNSVTFGSMIATGLNWNRTTFEVTEESALGSVCRSGDIRESYINRIYRSELFVPEGSPDPCCHIDRLPDHGFVRVTPGERILYCNQVELGRISFERGAKHWALKSSEGTSAIVFGRFTERRVWVSVDVPELSFNFRLGWAGNRATWMSHENFECSLLLAYFCWSYSVDRFM